MVQYSLPSDSIAFIPLIHSDQEGKPYQPGPGWTVKSSDPSVKADFAGRTEDDAVRGFAGDGRFIKLTPTAAKGGAQVVYERDLVRDTLEVTITPPVVTRVAFDVSNAKLLPIDEEREPGRADPARHDWKVSRAGSYGGQPKPIDAIVGMTDAEAAAANAAAQKDTSSASFIRRG